MGGTWFTCAGVRIRASISCPETSQQFYSAPALSNQVVQTTLTPCCHFLPYIYSYKLAEAGNLTVKACLYPGWHFTFILISYRTHVFYCLLSSGEESSFLTVPVGSLWGFSWGFTSCHRGPSLVALYGWKDTPFPNIRFLFQFNCCAKTASLLPQLLPSSNSSWKIWFILPCQCRDWKHPTGALP